MSRGEAQRELQRRANLCDTHDVGSPTLEDYRLATEGFVLSTWADKGLMVLVDGKQRLEAVRKFLRNELPIFGGNFINDFNDPRRLLRSSDAYFEIRVNNLKTRKEILTWYLQLNTGGVVHTEEEIAKVRRMLENEKRKDNLEEVS